MRFGVVKGHMHIFTYQHSWAFLYPPCDTQSLRGHVCVTDKIHLQCVLSIVYVSHQLVDLR